MNRFHILTLIIATIIFSILLIYISINLFKKNTKFPRVINNCPDKWKTDLSGNCIIDSKSGNIGDLSGRPLYIYDDFSNSDDNSLKQNDGNNWIGNKKTINGLKAQWIAHKVVRKMPQKLLLRFLLYSFRKFIYFYSNPIFLTAIKLQQRFS